MITVPPRPIKSPNLRAKTERKKDRQTKRKNDRKAKGQNDDRKMIERYQKDERNMTKNVRMCSDRQRVGG